MEGFPSRGNLKIVFSRHEVEENIDREKITPHHFLRERKSQANSIQIRIHIQCASNPIHINIVINTAKKYTNAANERDREKSHPTLPTVLEHHEKPSGSQTATTDKREADETSH